MDPRFDDIFQSPENDIFKVVFFPDRIYHAQYLNATVSPRYRYNVREVRGKHDIQILKGDVYLDGQFQSTFLRIEYRASRLVEVAREKDRLLRRELLAWLRLHPNDPGRAVEAMVKLHYCAWIDAYQAEIWHTLEPPPGSRHDFRVLALAGRGGSITRVPAFTSALEDIKSLRDLAIAFREDDRDRPFGYAIGDPQWDNNFASSHEDPHAQPSTVKDQNYYITFQRGWFLDAGTVAPVHYTNAMMDPDNPEWRSDNVVNMKWLVQRELGGKLVYFHEVILEPGMIEGTHRHIGSEELYFIVDGTGIAYMGDGDDPTTDGFPTVERSIYGLGRIACKELPVRRGNVIYTKSGGIHGIRAAEDSSLRFVAFGYQSS